MFKRTMMLWTTISVCGILSAQEPILSFDYISGKQASFGNRAPVVKGETVPAKGTSGAIRLDGRTNYIAVPGSQSLHLKKGGTLFALVKMDQDDDIGMIFFKYDEFLLALRDTKLYFNMRSEGSKRFDHAFSVDGIVKGKWHTVAAVLQMGDSNACTVSLYIDGDKKGTKTFQLLDGYPKSNHMLTIGRGWGGRWFLKGEIGVVRIYDVPLADASIKELIGKYAVEK